MLLAAAPLLRQVSLFSFCHLFGEGIAPVLICLHFPKAYPPHCILTSFLNLENW
jgi:hypothetical protein